MFLISVDSARPDGTKTCTLMISALRSCLISVSLSGWPGLGEHFAGLGIDDVGGEHARRRALAALDGVQLVAQVDRHVRREDLDRLDALPAQAVEHLFGELVAFA